MEILGIIPARGGSKTIKRKNIKLLNGKPLLTYTCEAALRSKLISRVVLSSEDDEIIEVAKKCGVDVPFKRPKYLAQDNSLAQDVVLHLLNKLKKKLSYVPDIIIYLQPTSPLRTSKDIDKALSLLIDNYQAKAIVSVMQVPHNFIPECIYQMNSNGRLDLYKNAKVKLLRQHKPLYYARNAAIYAMKTECFVKHKSLILSDSIPYVMNYEHSIDIDSIYDFILVNQLLKKKVGEY